MSVSVSAKANINLLHPKTAAKVAKLMELCRDKEIPLLITDTLRNRADQDRLYAQGRSASGKIVTQAKYPDSPHCWGIAADFCKNVKGHEFDDSPFFSIVGELAESVGFDWGGRWTRFRDLPHLQDKDFDVTELKHTYGTLENFLKTWSS
jgi:peptidoglycan L-alanyl-D-glutamate endopeptidase CwlK